MSLCSASNRHGSSGRLTFPHAISASLVGSRTMNLSFGDRPVCCPVRHASGPSAAMTPLVSTHRLLVEHSRGQVPAHPIGLDAFPLQTTRAIKLNAHQTLPKRLSA